MFQQAVPMEKMNAQHWKRPPYTAATNINRGKNYRRIDDAAVANTDKTIGERNQDEETLKRHFYFHLPPVAVSKAKALNGHFQTCFSTHCNHKTKMSVNSPGRI